MTLVKYKNQVEYSFISWVNHCPESNHLTDDKNFYFFVRNVCRYNAKKWKNTDYLIKRIKEKISDFNPIKLESIVALYSKLLYFYKAQYLHSSWFIDPSAREVKTGYYLERGVKDGELYEVEKLKKAVY